MKTLEEINKTLSMFSQANSKYLIDFEYPRTCRYMLEDIQDIIFCLADVRDIITKDEENACLNLESYWIDLIWKKTELEERFKRNPSRYLFQYIRNIENLILITEWALNRKDFDLCDGL